MYAVERLSSYISRGVYTVSGPFHPFGGAVDIIVVEQEDGSFKSSPWYVRFGKFQGVLKTKEKIVNISVNGAEADLHMYLDHKGEAYFLREVDGEEGDSVLYPLSSGIETDEQSQNRRPLKAQSCNFDSNKPELVNQIDVNNGKIVARTGSRRSRLLGLVFGRRSMKEDRFQDGEGSPSGMVRITSLERAEIAADLLEMKWSTDLATKKPKKDNTSRHSATDILDGEGINDGESEESSFVPEDIENRSEHSVSHDGAGSLDSNVGNSSEFGLPKSECSNGDTTKISSLDTLDQAVEIPALGESELEEGCCLIPQMSKDDKFCVGSSVHGEKSKDVISEATSTDSHIPNLPELETCPGKQSGEEQMFDQKDVVLPGQDVSEEGETHRVRSFLYCETSESSTLRLDGSSDETHETLFLSCAGCGEVDVHAEALHVSEVSSPLESGVLLTKDPLNNTGVIGDRDGLNLLHDRKNIESEGTSMSTVTNSIVTESVSSIDAHLVTSNAVESEALEVVQHGSVTETPAENINLNGEEVEVSENNSEHKNPAENHEVDLEEPSTAQESQMVSNSNCVLSESVTISPWQGSDEQNLLFNDLISSNPSDNIHIMESASPLSQSSSDGLVQDNLSSVIIEEFIEKQMTRSSSITIPGIRKVAGEEVGRLVKSLPNILSHTDNMDTLHLRRSLSDSLDSSSKILNSALLGNDVSNCIKSDADEEEQLAPERQTSTSEGTEISVELQNVMARHGVEISLCKHLLYEGMGAEAASQAFDSEKLDLDKFASLGPDVIKNDRLIVRIGSHYFPWYAAASIILRMVSFGSEQLLEPEGIIAVDQVEKTQEADPSKSIVVHNGSWRIWPFSLKRSRSMKPLQPTLNGTGSSDAQNASESRIGMGGDKSVIKTMVTKKIRTKTPTSEQLALLNLKEGRNTVTFTFSTAVLGNQQVDARIYLWKWNTRIVISDVDGTITRSDVLGQFMPMVGIDWSQTGVAHLFSAIKENGYQLLFLSARAISQARHTRSFLFNLKQDGKALPDGPVVISPDGLFPSLFREVIRRAPHEFKIACLEGIKALFPSDCNPFYAGFGNRDTDEISYLKVGIPKGKIFIINPKGHVAVNRCVDTKSYTSLHELVNGMFPPMSSSEQEDYNSWNFWKLPPPDLDV
ncbi:phosphatidate phosphatase PAH2 [Malania oleifera]|uniref:phosphatidate phosphatase PAH2 n=1 Tax=Malania oleifera TaxID=397392 RepID=UPI0025ADAE1F|nr:phosphatidate phosphatase PAH2 [Malania oleifera]